MGFFEQNLDERNLRKGEFGGQSSGKKGQQKNVIFLAYVRCVGETQKDI